MSFTVPRRALGERGAAGVARLLREFAAVSAVLVGYFGLRVVVEGDRVTATRNARRLLDVEARLGIDIERGIQDAVVDLALVEGLLSAAYVWLHWPLLVATMVFLTLRAPAVQARFRNALLVSGAIGVLLFATVPMAPPRFLPGFVGTVSDSARRHYLPYPLDWTNQFAAFPSYHVGWTLIACLAVAGAVRGRHRWWLLTPAVLVAVAAVATGNHYVLDSLTGAALAVAAWWAVGQRPPRDGRHRDAAGVLAGAGAADRDVAGADAGNAPRSAPLRRSQGGRAILRR